MTVNTELMHLSVDFVSASRAVGKIIISEVYLPFSEKVFFPLLLYFLSLFLYFFILLPYFLLFLIFF